MSEKKFTQVRELDVEIDFGEGAIHVGRLASREHKIYFEYDKSFLDLKLPLSPFKLPLEVGVKSFEKAPFDGLPGVFDDSLPDGWGRLLFDRLMRSKGILSSEMSALDRLSFIRGRPLGALFYRPSLNSEIEKGKINLDHLANEAKVILRGDSSHVLNELVLLNGSSAGARPKALVDVSDKFDQLIYGEDSLLNGYSHWIVKFPNLQDGLDAGAIEYVYALMAKRAGIQMTDVHLFEGTSGASYFGIERFDLNHHERYHMHTVSGLLHLDFRVPSLDYEDIIALTTTLTRDMREAEKLYRLAVFNVLSHNRDDHAKNFSFLMDKKGIWRLSPAYDLTFSAGPGGEQSTTVMGEGRSPRIYHLKKLAQTAGISENLANEIIEKTKESLLAWPKLAKEFGVKNENIKFIQKKILSLLN